MPTKGPYAPKDTMEPGPGSLSFAGQIDIQAGLDKYVSDIIVSTDLQDNIIYWNRLLKSFMAFLLDRLLDSPFGR